MTCTHDFTLKKIISPNDIDFIRVYICRKCSLEKEKELQVQEISAEEDFDDDLVVHFKDF